MPYYNDSLTKAEMEKVRRANRCSICGGMLAMFSKTGKYNDPHYLACSNTPTHDGITREYIKKTERDDLIRSVYMTNETAEDRNVAVEVSRRNLPVSGRLDKEQALEVLRLVYPSVPDIEIERAALLCRDYGLHPLMKEVYLIPFNTNKGTKEKPKWETEYSLVIGISANRKIAEQRKGAYSFLDDTPRAASQEEVDKQFGPDSEEQKGNLVSVTKLKGESGNLATGWGLWPKDKIPKGTDKGNTKRNMCNIRSERQALDRLPGGDMPKVEVMDEKYIEVEGNVVDTATGEITEESKPEEVSDGEFREVPPEILETPEPGPTGPADDIFKEDEKPEVTEDKDRVLTTEEQRELVDLSNAADMGGTVLRKWCNAPPRNWNIHVFKNDLKKWMFDEIKEALDKGKP